MRVGPRAERALRRGLAVQGLTAGPVARSATTIAASAAAAGAGRRDRRAEQAGKSTLEVAYKPPGAGAGLLREGAGSGKPRKRRVALVYGYSGVGYRGSQLHAPLEAAHAGAVCQAQGEYKSFTVEAELMRAVYAAGGILPSNYLAEAKLGWQRMSRTDRGVSALGNVVTAKLLLAAEAEGGDPWGQDPEGLKLAAAINEHLPDAVRVFSVQSVPQSFRPRLLCRSRVYKLWVPASPAGLGSGSPAALQRLQEALQCYEGRLPFHNFTKMNRYAPAKRYGGVKGEGRGGEGPKANEGDNTEGDGPRGDRRCRPPGMQWLSDRQGSVGVESGGGVHDAHYRRVLRFECGPPQEIVPGSGREYVELTVEGDSFMYNQIRHMVGGALAVSSGHLPLQFLECALSEPARARLPLAPPETLVLVGSEFPPFRGPAGVPQAKGDPRRLRLGEGGLCARQNFWNSHLAQVISEAGASGGWDEFFQGLGDVCRESRGSDDDLARVLRLHEGWRDRERDATRKVS